MNHDISNKNNKHFLKESSQEDIKNDIKKKKSYKNDRKL